MTYKVTVTFKDDKQANILVPDKNVTHIKKCLLEGSALDIFNEETSVGFWCALTDVRHVVTQIHVAEEEKKEPEEKEEPSDQ